MKMIERKIGKNFFTWFRSFALVMAVTCGLVIALIQWMENSFVDEIMDLNKRLAINIQADIDVRLNDIDNFIAVFMLTPDNLLLSKSTEINMNEKEAMIRVSTKLNEYKLSNRFIEDIGIYYPKIDYMVGNIGYFFIKQYYMLENENDDYKYRDWKEELVNNEKNGYQIKRKFDGTNDLIFTKWIPYNNFRRDAILLLKINKKEVEKVLKSEDYKNTSFESAMLDLDGNDYISSKDGDNAWIKDLNVMVQGNQIETKDYLGIIRQSEYYDINYITVCNKNEVLQKSHFIKYLAFIFVAFFMAVGCLLFWMMGRRNNRPIKQLIEKLEDGNNNMAVDEYAFLENWIDYMQYSDNQYQKRLLKQQEVMERQFLYNLLLSEEKNNSAIFSSMQRFNLQFNFTTYQIMLIRSRKSFNDEQQKSMLEAVNEIARKYKDKIYMIATELKGDIVILCHMDSEYDFDKQISLYNELTERLDFLQADISIYGGGVYDTMSEIILSYHQARMLAEKDKDKDAGISIYHDDIPYINDDGTQSDVMEEFTVEMLEEEYEKAGKLLDRLFNQYINKENNIFKARAKKYAVINSVIEALYKRKELKDIRKEYIHSMEITKDNQSLLDEINKILDILQEAKKTELNRYKLGCAAKAKEYIDNHYEDPMIGLYQISEELGISNTYLSSDFKKKYEIGVAQYINKLRIEKAKVMMLNTEYSIKEIAFHVGFSNDMTFIRVFKQFENTTPGRFKKENS